MSDTGWNAVVILGALWGLFWLIVQLLKIMEGDPREKPNRKNRKDEA